VAGEIEGGAHLHHKILLNKNLDAAHFLTGADDERRLSFHSPYCWRP